MTAAILNYDALHPWIEMVLVCWLCVAVVQQVLAWMRNREAELDLRDKQEAEDKYLDRMREKESGIWDD